MGVLNHYFRIDYLSNLTNVSGSRFSRFHVYDVPHWRTLLQLMDARKLVDPDTKEVVFFSMLVKIEKVSKGVRL